MIYRFDNFDYYEKELRYDVIYFRFNFIFFCIWGYLYENKVLFLKNLVVFVLFEVTIFFLGMIIIFVINN